MKRPATIMMAAVSLCGQIGPKGFTSDEDRTFLEIMRDSTDASIIGASTLREEDPEFRGSGGVLAPNRIRAVVSNSCCLPLDKKLVNTGPRPFLFTTKEQVDPAIESKFNTVKTAVAHGGVSVTEALSVLYQAGAATVLLEGGGRFNHACLEQGVVDDIFFTICPVLGGYPNAPHVVTAPEKTAPVDWRRLELVDCRKSSSGDIFAHYKPIGVSD